MDVPLPRFRRPDGPLGLGTAKFELCDIDGAYRHLAYYATIATHDTWPWCWLGRAALAVGEHEEGHAALERARTLEDATGVETDAVELLSWVEPTCACPAIGAQVGRRPPRVASLASPAGRAKETPMVEFYWDGKNGLLARRFGRAAPELLLPSGEWRAFPDEPVSLEYVPISAAHAKDRAEAVTSSPAKQMDPTVDPAIERARVGDVLQ